MIKTAIVVAASYAAGKAGGNLIAKHAGVTSDTTKTALQIGTGVVSFFVLSSIVR